MKRMLVGLFVVMIGAAPIAAGAPIQQAIANHSGTCTGNTDFHIVPTWKNETGRPVTLVLLRLIAYGTGDQPGYLVRSGDGFVLADASMLNPPGVAGRYSGSYDRPVEFAPGDGLTLIHWCEPPDVYGFFTAFDYATP